MLEPLAQLAWIKLLCHVKVRGSHGRAKALSTQAAGKKWNIPVPAVARMLRAAIEDGALEAVDGDWFVTGWARYQEPDSTATERKRRQRERQNPATREVLPFPLADRCDECGSTEDLTLDHVQPWSRGGRNDPANYQTLCRSCNSRKRARVTHVTRDARDREAGHA